MRVLLIKMFVRLNAGISFHFSHFPSVLFPLSSLADRPQSRPAPEIDLRGTALVTALFFFWPFVIPSLNKSVFLSVLSVLAAERGSLALWHDLVVHLSHLASVRVNVQVNYNNSEYTKGQGTRPALIEIKSRAKHLAKYIISFTWNN